MLYKWKADYLQRRLLACILFITPCLSTEAFAGSNVNVTVLCFLCPLPLQSAGEGYVPLTPFQP